MDTRKGRKKRERRPHPQQANEGPRAGGRGGAGGAGRDRRNWHYLLTPQWSIRPEPTPGVPRYRAGVQPERRYTGCNRTAQGPVATTGHAQGTDSSPATTGRRPQAARDPHPTPGVRASHPETPMGHSTHSLPPAQGAPNGTAGGQTGSSVPCAANGTPTRGGRRDPQACARSDGKGPYPLSPADRAPRPLRLGRVGGRAAHVLPATPR